MDTSFAASLAFTLQAEGGWSDNADDPGGPTMKGITFATFCQHYPGSTLDDLRNITDDQVADIYRTGYWNAVKGDDLPAGVDLSIWDFGVNAGPRCSTRILQACVVATVDGIIGPRTLSAVRRMDPADLVAALAERQQAYYESLATFDEFGTGWTRRTAERQKAALTLITT